MAISAKIDDLGRLASEFDAFYRTLGNVLPEINLEVYKTYKKASATLETLTSPQTPGKIDRLISAIAGHLESAIHHVDELQRQDRRIFNVLSDFSAEFEAMANNWDSCHPDDFDAPPLLTRFMDLRHLHAAVLDPLGQIIAAEADMAEDLERYRTNELKSLENTLTSITLILVDLIKRSDATKQPILNIMTSLQLHDIISQDLHSLDRCLGEIDAINQNGSASEGALTFVASALPLISALLEQIAAIFAHETDQLRSEALLILKTITNEREDKVLLSDFLLENQQRRSTFDSLLGEISDMLTDVLNKLELLAARRWLLPGQLTSLLDLAELLIKLIDNHAEQFAACTPGLEQIRQTLGEMIAIKSDIDFYRLEELKGFVAEMESGLTSTISDLHEIRALMIDSVAGIDTYSARCLNYLDQFRQTLDQDQRIVAMLEDLAQLPSGSLPAAANDRAQFDCSFRHELFERLKRPHLSSVLRNECEPEDGLTVF